MKLKCMLIDDEPNAVKLLEVFIDQVTDWEIVATCYDGLEAIQALKAVSPHFVFLDINMPYLNGLELAALLPKETRIVFTTAYAAHAVESYNLAALDYLLKPITLKRFLQAQQKVETHFAAELSRPLGVDNENAQYYFFKSGKSMHKVLLRDILYFEGEREYVQLVTTTESLLIYRRMKELEQQLKYPYVRVHNSFIVNMQHVDKYADNHIFIGEKRVPVSDKYRGGFHDHLNDQLF